MIIWEPFNFGGEFKNETVTREKIAPKTLREWTGMLGITLICFIRLNVPPSHLSAKHKAVATTVLA